MAADAIPGTPMAPPGSDAVRVLSWNVQGRELTSPPDVARVIDAFRPDVVLLQEVQRRQARAIAEWLGWRDTWRFKHWPVVYPAEGLAVLSPLTPGRVRKIVLAEWWSFWSWRRRIAVGANVAVRGHDIGVVNTHLGAAVGDTERSRQAGLVVDLAEPASAVGGDMNTAPGSDVVAVFAGRGFVDAWVTVNPDVDGPTNWPPGPRDRPPSQRLDYVFVPAPWEVVAATVPRFGEPGFERFGALSDHLPVVVDLVRR